ncbi:hypothetical protein ES703_123190 [subsurface metagenome]
MWQPELDCLGDEGWGINKLYLYILKFHHSRGGGVCSKGVFSYGWGGVGNAGDKLRLTGIGQTDYGYLPCPFFLNDH